MEIESANHQDVAEPDQIASGVAGTGHENRIAEEIIGKHKGNSPPRSEKPERMVLGLGVLYNGPANAGNIPGDANSPGPDPCTDLPESPGDLILFFYERQERIAERLTRKIERLDRRLTKIEERRRSA